MFVYAGPVANPDNIEFEPSDGVMQMTWNDVNADRYEVIYKTLQCIK